MCIFCGSQCGLSEFLIAIGLPFLGLYFYRIKNALVNIKNKIFRRDSSTGEILDETVKCRCCGELPQDCQGPFTPAIDPQDLELMEVSPQHNRLAESTTIIAKSSAPLRLTKKQELKGVRGWLLLLCLILGIFIPAACLYETISIYYLINSPILHLMPLVSNKLILFHIILIPIIWLSATFSFYAGWQLLEVKPGAVKIAKTCLIIQLFIAVIAALIRSLIIFPFAHGEHNLIVITRLLIPSLIHFGLWYLYLNKSRRVHNTYKTGEEKNLTIVPLPVKL